MDLASEVLVLEVDGAPALDLMSFQPPGGAEVLVRPTSFRIVTSGVQGLLPETTSVRFSFEGAAAGPGGLPDVTAPGHVPMTSDMTLLGAAAPDFVRFEVLFDLDALGLGLSAASPRPSLDFMRLELRF